MDSMTEMFGEPISIYTRAQAIEDGVLVDLMQEETVSLVKEAGFNWPVAMTATAFHKAVSPIGGELPPGQDLNGRLWDVLNLLKFSIRKGGTDVQFPVRVWTGKRQVVVRLRAVAGPGDNGEPVITIMLHDED